MWHQVLEFLEADSFVSIYGYSDILFNNNFNVNIYEVIILPIVQTKKLRLRWFK